MSAFEDFVNLELPRRPIMLTLEVSGYSGDPNSVGAPSLVQNAPKGSFYLDDVTNDLWHKETNASGTWAIVGGASTPDGTIAPLTWYVTTSGNDSTGDGTVGAPFATPAGAIDKLRSTYGTRVRHLVDIIVGAGNYPGFTIQGFEFDPVDSSLPCGIRVSGAWIAPTLATGTATGTFTAVTAGNTTSDVVFSIVTDGTQSWTVNDLKGKMIEFLTGSNATAILPIISNTATDITVPSISGVGSVGGTYAIREFGTVITTGVPFVPSLPAVNAVSQTPTPIYTGFAIANDMVVPASTEIRVEGIKVNLTSPPAGAVGINIQGNACTVTRCFSGGSATGPRVQVFGGVGNTTVSGCVINPANSSVISIASAGIGTQSFNNNFISAGSNFAGTGFVGLLSSSIGYVTCANTWIGAHSFGMVVSGAAILTVQGVNIIAGGSQCFRCRVIEGNSGQVFVNVNGLKCAGASGSTAFELQGPSFGSISALHGSGNAIGILLSYGASMKISAGSTITGTTEILMDNAYVTTLATMRAQSPKVLTTSYGTTIAE